MTLTATRPLAALDDDNRGAVLMTGLFMSCFLIGSLWFIVGIGDAIVYRDRMQEATDHGAFAASAISAKGMNFISLCNLVLLVAVTIHIVLGIVNDIALAVCIISWGTTCGFYGEIHQLWIDYFDILKPAARAIHQAGKVGSYGFPVMGLAESLAVGKSYAGGKSGKPIVIALSPSMLSGTSFSIGGAQKKEGLTIESKPMSLVCHKVGELGIDFLFKTALGASGKGFGGKILDLAKKIIGQIIEVRYCNDMSGKQAEKLQAMLRVKDFMKQAQDAMGTIGKIEKVSKILGSGGASALGGSGGSGGGAGGGGGNDPNGGSSNGGSSSSSSSGGSIDPGFDKFWGEDGPMAVIGPAKNGNSWFQSYAVNFNPAMSDVSKSYVNMAAGPKNLKGKFEEKVNSVGGFYIAQAEYYFDCEQKWSNEGCNFDANSTFAIKWRARLRRFSIPSFQELLGEVGGAFLSKVPQYQQFQQLKGELDLGKDIFGSSGVVGMSQLKGYLGNAAQAAEGEMQNQLESQAKGALKNLNVPFH